ncbi:MAG: FHA domain-containing protein [Planctomycetaceae bacterium]|nr:FHA domain-containing protein [Planctomycetaceae bacterium]
MSNFARIQVLNGKSTGVYEVPSDGKFIIGRLTGCQIVIDGPTVSRQHCVIEYTTRRDRIINTSSTATLLNGKPIESAELADNDVITVGNVLLRYIAPDQKRGMERGEIEYVSGEKRVAFHESSLAARMLGQNCGNTTLLATLSSREMMDVFIGYRYQTRAITAVKVLSPHATEPVRKRFTRGATFMSKLAHPGLPLFHDQGQIQGRPFASVGFVDGIDLASIVPEDQKSHTRKVVGLGLDVLHLLEYLEERNIVLRNLCPENLMLAHREVAKVVNLDYATEGGETVPAKDAFAGASLSVLRHRAPECHEDTVTANFHADQFSLASVMYASIAGGRAPWDPVGGDVASSFSRDTFKKDPVPLDARVKGVDPFLWGALQVALKPDPTKRYNTTTDFRYELEAAAKSLRAGA